MEPSTRRAFIAAAVGALGLSLIDRKATLATDGQPVLIGRYNAGDNSTTIVGVGNSGATIGEAKWALGARNTAPSGFGVRGIATADAGVGISGEVTGAKSVGVFGDARSAGAGSRGGVFAGAIGEIPLRIMPDAYEATHPPAGKRGDLFIDRTGRLWLCKGTTHWALLG